MRKLLLLSTLLLSLTACDVPQAPTPKVTQDITPKPKTSSDSGDGLGMSYRGGAGVYLGNGLVVTGKGVSLGFGF